MHRDVNPVDRAEERDGERGGDDSATGRDRETESEPTESGHSTADTQVERNKEDEPPG